MKRATRAVGLGLLGILAIVRAKADGAAFLVGVLERVPGAQAGEPARPHVRAVFLHDTHGWQALPYDCPDLDCLTTLPPQYPPRVAWSVSLNGLTLGSLTARTPEEFGAYAWVGLQDISGKGAIPFVGKPRLEYAGFQSVPVLRPLLATSGRARPLRSKALWEQGAPDPADLDRVWPVFRRHIPQIDDCDAPVGADDAGTAGVAPGKRGARAPTRLELEIPVAWVARNGDALLKVAVREEAFRECDGPRSLPSQLWVLRRAQGETRALPGQGAADGPGLVAPLDIVDLLRDGHDEALFLAAGYNSGGYVLYSEGFRKVTRFTWKYQ